MQFVTSLLVFSVVLFAVPAFGSGARASSSEIISQTEKSEPDIRTYNVGVNPDGIDVFRTTWIAIIEEAGIKANYFKYDFIKRNKMFLRGDLVLECCSIPKWHDSKEEQEVQLYTESFFSTYEHLIHNKDKKIEILNLEEVAKYKISMVKGFNHKGDHLFKDVQYFETITESLKAVDDGLADIAFVNNQEFGKFQRHHPNNLTLGIVWEHIPFAIRVRKNEAHLLPRLNTAIRKLRNNGTIIRLVGASLRRQYK